MSAKKPITIQQAISDAVIRLHECGIESAQLDASVLLAHALGLTKESIILQRNKIINNHDIKAFSKLVSRRAEHEPIAYITGRKEFWSLDFIVTRDTLIPRPDSETLVDAALQRAKKIADSRNKPLTLADISILDIGTGTGCLLISILKELPSAHGLGVDISEPALQVAENNGNIHGVNNRIRFRKSNWHDDINEKFDLIISNPPYITNSDLPLLMKDVINFEPHLALASGIDGMDSYRAIAKNIHSKLNQNGYALMEVGIGQAKHVARLLENNGLEIDEVRKDLAGTQRCVIARETH